MTRPQPRSRQQKADHRPRQEAAHDRAHCRQGQGTIRPEGGGSRPFCFFPDRNLREKRAMWLSVIGNGLLIVWLGIHLGGRAITGQVAPIVWPIGIIAGLFLGDLASGFVHWAVDTWFDARHFGRLILIAREHHTHPSHILGYGFLEHSTLGSGPAALFLAPLALSLLLMAQGTAADLGLLVIEITALCLFFGTSFHNLGHRRSRSRLVRFLQGCGLLLTPAHHQVHHRPPQMVRYCVVNGWANPLCDRLGLWRGLEWLVTALTGAEPRRDDRDWQCHWKTRLPLLEARQGDA